MNPVHVNSLHESYIKESHTSKGLVLCTSKHQHSARLLSIQNITLDNIDKISIVAVVMYLQVTAVDPPHPTIRQEPYGPVVHGSR